MVSSANNNSSCTVMDARGKVRYLNVDFKKDFAKPLQVETSVEYDLPSHIYPPKGSAPILMINPNYSILAARTSKANDSSVVRPLSSLQINCNSGNQSRTKVSQSKKIICSCGIPNCTAAGSSSRVNANTSSRSYLQQNMVNNSRQVQQQIPENQVVHTNSVKSLHINSSEIKSSNKVSTVKSNMQKQYEYQQHLQRQMYERAKIQQAQQFQQQLQQQQQQQQQNVISNSNILNSNESWNLTTKCQYSCCQNILPSATIASGLPPQEFLQPGIHPSLFSRNPSRGASGGSPKLRAKLSRRGLNAANTVNLPEYLGSARSSRTSSVSGLSSHTRTRSASMLTAHSNLVSTLDVVRALTPRSLLAANQQLQSSSLLSLVGQSRDSGCSVSADNFSTGIPTNNTSLEASTDWSHWNLVDSGFCTPVDTSDDSNMEYQNTTSLYGSSSTISAAAATTNNLVNSQKEANAHWMNSYQQPITATTLGKLQAPFVPQTNHYIPQPIWNLAY